MFIALPPTAAVAGVVCAVAKLAEGLQVVRAVVAAVREGCAMVNQYGGDALASSQAHLAQRVGRQVSSTDGLPRMSIAFGCGRVALLLLIAPGLLLGVGVAITLVCQGRAAGVGAGLRGFVWHGVFLQYM